MHLFAPLIVRNAHYRRFQYRRMLVEGVFDLHRIDILAATDNHVFGPVYDVNIKIFVNRGEVARVQPTVPQAISTFLTQLPVTLHNIGASRNHLAHLPRLDVLHFIINHPHYYPRHRLTRAHQTAVGQRTFFGLKSGAVGIRTQPGQQGGGLGHPITLSKLTGENLHRFFQNRYRDRRSSIQNRTPA